MKMSICFGTIISLLTASSLNAAQPALKDSFNGKFLVGAALNESQFTEANAIEAALVKKHFNTITPENVLKWERIEPQPGQFNFGPVDNYVAFGETNGMFLIGHTLVWHSQTPEWVFQNADRAILLERMSNHIHAVVGRYAGRIKGWDVVNEALNEDGTLRDSRWRRIIGDDYIEKAFQFAHEADPQAELYYNDYSLENPAKRAGAVALVKKIQTAGVTISAVGTQEHINLKWPAVQLVDDTLTELGQLGVKVNITELDIDVLPRASSDTSADVGKNITANPALNPYTNGLPDSVQQELGRRYAELFAAYQRHPGVVGRVTFWGVTDADSWLNDWPVRGRTNYPLLFDRAGNSKPAFTNVQQTARLCLAPPNSLSLKQP
jgi:endo-1,4-beta-xylanase